MNTIVVISNQSYKTQPSTVKIPIQINGFSNLHMPVLKLCISYHYTLATTFPYFQSNPNAKLYAARCYIRCAVAKHSQAHLSLSLKLAAVEYTCSLILVGDLNKSLKCKSYAFVLLGLLPMYTHILQNYVNKFLAFVNLPWVPLYVVGSISAL